MITTKRFLSTKGIITLFTIVNNSGASVVLSTLGAAIIEVNVPDSTGTFADVTLGYASPEDYICDGPACGKIPGRYANRIANGRFILDGHVYQLPINNGPNCNHSGDEGFHNRNWTIKETTENSVTFSYFSKDHEAGFPGNLCVEVKYIWTDKNKLKITLTATTDAPTVVNLTNHAYWNLKGHNSGSVLGHWLMLEADTYLPTDENLIPTGELASVKDTPMDFRSFKRIGKEINSDFPALKIGKGYDTCWVVRNHSDKAMKTVATLFEETSGRILEVISDQPGIKYILVIGYLTAR